MYKMNASVESELNRYIDAISILDGVKRIYLFGSYVNGEPHESSDLDLFVVISDDKDRFKVAYNIHKKLSNREVPLDVIVDHESTFEDRAGRVTLQNAVKAEGVLLYDKH